MIKLIVTFFAIILAYPIGWFVMYSPYFHRDTSHIEQLVNDKRVHFGDKPLLHSYVLENLANERLEEIISSKKFDHTGFIPMFNSQGVFHAMGENLAEGYSTDEEVLEAWINSPEHWRNIMGNWKFTAVVQKGKYVIQLFGNI